MRVMTIIIVIITIITIPFPPFQRLREMEQNRNFNFLGDQIIIMAQIIKPPSYQYDVLRIMSLQDKYVFVWKVWWSVQKQNFSLNPSFCLQSRLEKALDGFWMGRKSSNSLRDSGLETLKESQTLSWVGQIVGSRRLLQTRPHSSTVEHNPLRKA